ncbi:MAG TPA: hypothetical protein VFT50_16160 [Baekduia sp.]|nr:hypothetical protein [Baekduia sp.]
MRTIHRAAAALAAVIALTATGGAGSASAATLCNAPLNPCPAANVIPAPFVIQAAAPAPVTFTMGGFTVTCATSAFSDRILNNPGVPINDLIQNWTFGGCTLNPGGVPCTVVAIPNPPPLNWPTRITTPSTTPGADGDFAVDGFGVTITCQGMPPCTVVGAGPAQNITGPWYNPTTATPPKPIVSPHAVTSFASGVVGGPAPCGAGTFTGNYEVTLPPFPGADLWLV